MPRLIERRAPNAVSPKGVGRDQCSAGRARKGHDNRSGGNWVATFAVVLTSAAPKYLTILARMVAERLKAPVLKTALNIVSFLTRVPVKPQVTCDSPDSLAFLPVQGILSDHPISDHLTPYQPVGCQFGCQFG